MACLLLISLLETEYPYGRSEEMNTLRRMLKGESGASITEYALLLALVAIAVISVIILFREELVRTFVTIADALKGADASGSPPGGTHARPIGG